MQRPEQVFTVIADFVDSRKIENRREAQFAIDRVLNEVNELVRSAEPMLPTVGDELQGAYRSIADAIRATLLTRALLPFPLDCRFGIGFGGVEHLGQSTLFRLQDGDGWWAAREALDHAHGLQKSRRHGSLRTWFTLSSRADPPHGFTRETSAWINAYLLVRDSQLGTLDQKDRTVLADALTEKPQRYTAERLGISQAAVSKRALQMGVNAIVEGLDVLEGAFS